VSIKALLTVSALFEYYTILLFNQNCADVLVG